MALGLVSPVDRPSSLAFAHILNRWDLFHIKQLGWIFAEATKRILLMETEDRMLAILPHSNDKETEGQVTKQLRVIKLQVYTLGL